MLRPRDENETQARLAVSVAAREGAGLRTEDVTGWLDACAATHRFRVDRIPFAGLGDWSFDADTGNLRHRSGRFFSVEGLRVSVDEVVQTWSQPIIRQPEIGVLGILVKEIDGVLHCLMQAKMEPGNPNLLQLSPTVQATRSNYTGVHGGSQVRYLEYFTEPGRGRVLADVLQSEHGSWFHCKSNRNMVVEATDDVTPADGFCWLTLGQIAELLRRDHVVNMDARTVLACLPLTTQQQEGRALLTDAELLSWITGERSRRALSVERIPLSDVDGWVRGPDSIRHEQGRYFSVVAVSVVAGNREVATWRQPLFEPHGTGVTAFLRREISGVPHVLVNAKVEGGLLDTLELAPTVQCTPENYAHLPAAQRPGFLDLVLTAEPHRRRYEALHSEEGGRFLNATSRYLIIDVTDDDVPHPCPPGFQWVTPAQLGTLVRHGHYVNVQARTLLACLTTGAVEP
ncbi:NDP-hexose 2,3-dehydratase family protein [Streptomyces pimonensis]|uniref:NDP-hexose 2,3-dehydratase family protein n=2 Tax=Streptomyces pimonensis TaxID=2860288 RepID=A0ABV4J6N5_9ACTN